jgi:hypothetical protein
MDIFPLVDDQGRLFPPTVQAAILAKYCRSAESARDLIAGVDEAKAAAFQEKWVLGFGHKSVAELATIPICFEGVSIVASKMIERLQRIGCAEKSTRVQKFGRESFVPDKIPELGLAPELTALAHEAYDLYDSLVEQVGNQFASDPTKKGMSPLDLSRATFDVCRYLLPAGTATNLGIVVNLTDLSGLISELMASGNPEFCEIGSNLLGCSSSLGGPLIRHVQPEPWLAQWEPRYGWMGPHRVRDVPCVHVVSQPPEGAAERIFTKALLFYHMTSGAFDSAMRARPEKCEVPKIFGTEHFGFNVTVDYGAFRDLQRHRRCTQIPAPLTTQIGYVIPDPIRGTPAGTRFADLMDKFALYGWRRDALARVQLDQYAIPMAFLHSTHFEMDVRELYYIVELRTPKAGRHIAYRRIAWWMYELARQADPSMMQWCRAVDPSKD